MGWFRSRRFRLEDRVEAMLEGRVESALDRVKLSDWLEFSDLVGRVGSLEDGLEGLEVDGLEDQRQALEVRLEVCETEGAVDRESIGELVRRVDRLSTVVEDLLERERLDGVDLRGVLARVEGLEGL